MIGAALTGPTKRRIRPYLWLGFGIFSEIPSARSTPSRVRARREALFGRYWIYDDDRRAPQALVVSVRRWLFNEFFRAHGAPELTPLFCALDRLWAEELSDPRYRVRFSRDTTLAARGTHCVRLHTCG